MSIQASGVRRLSTVTGKQIGSSRSASRKVQRRHESAGVLKALPPGFVDDLPVEDQEAISEVVGKTIALNGYEDDGRAELEFTDTEGVLHIIYVDPKFIVKDGQRVLWGFLNSYPRNSRLKHVEESEPHFW
jgi:hypothetical protein